MSQNVSPEAAEQLVQEVSSWYAEQIMKEQRTPETDRERLRVLMEGMAACAADRARLLDADAEEVNAIAARYAARVQELGGR
ncbi:hypothetical protein AB0467_34390 [Streptomyces sp. NPDC052095]|uniref:hypothetical protein n=1 Tax=unclassified Streptomyces TaxID=2593676 RepID=UPI00344F22F1